MSIDWITVAAQIANFLVLVWLLKRFLYRPILDGIDAREAEISARMQEAAIATDEAARTEADYRGKLRELAAARDEAAEAAREAAEAERDAMLAAAQERLDREYASWKTQMDDEARNYSARMHRAGAEALLSLTRKALRDLADETLEALMAQRLVQQIRPMAPELKRAAGGAPSAATVSSRDPLPAKVAKAMNAELKAIFPKVDVRFDTDADQSPGLVLRIGGAQLDWTVESYVEGLGAQITARLAADTDHKARTHD
ncbi:F0F1 ATP synthase subunit delta [Roseovarius sp. S4756]|uniref:F0F1 ATP synthase subunit delta n=1 Tax=Roseovarius maritimus TaxID=3342637 RepID=UPI00372C32D1